MLPAIVTVNPFMKHRKTRAKHKRAHNRLRYRAHRSHRAHNTFHRRRRRSHSVHNPFSVRGLSSSLMPALIGAGGAIGTDIAMAYLPLPASLQSGWMNLLTRAAVAVGVGYVAGMISNKMVGKEVAAGGLIVVAYSGLKQALAPTLGNSVKGLSGLADFGDYAPAYSAQPAAMMGAGMGAYMRPQGLGAYMRPMGAYMNPAPFLTAGGGGAPTSIMTKQRAMAGFGGFGGYDSDNM